MTTSSPQLDPARWPELYEAVCQLHGSLELSEVLDRALAAAHQLTRAEHGLFVYLNEITEIKYNEQG